LATIDSLVACGYHVNTLFNQAAKMSRDPQINIRISQELKDSIHALAEANKRSVNAELVAAIEFWTAEKGTKADSFIADLTKRIEDLEKKINK
jgi:hypothetical protein